MLINLNEKQMSFLKTHRFVVISGYAQKQYVMYFSAYSLLLMTFMYRY